jgi:hypothetical protein
MSKIKIIHVHTDLKFLNASKKFENNNFENITIVIGDKGNYKGVYSESALFFQIFS